MFIRGKEETCSGSAPACGGAPAPQCGGAAACGAREVTPEMESEAQKLSKKELLSHDFEGRYAMAVDIFWYLSPAQLAGIPI